MQILLLLTDLFDATGGIQTFNRSFVKALDDLSVKHNINVKVLVLNDTGKSSLSAKYISSGNIEYKYFSGNRFKFFIHALKESARADKVIFGHINFSPLAVLMNSGAKKYLTIYGIEAWKKLNYFKLAGVRSVNKILSISVYTKRQIKNYNEIINTFTIFPCTLDPFYQAQPGVDEDLVLPIGTIILSVARLDPRERYKNIDLVIKALPEVLKNIPDAYYVIVGEGTDRFRLELLAKNLGVRDNVIFAGFIPDDLLSLYYESCDIFILPSTGEGFGIVFLEAMYFSKPCIGANAGGIPEVIKDKETGILCSPNDSTSLSDSIIKLLKDNDLRNKMGKKGKERFESKFGFCSFKEKLGNIICEF
ncbi:MAG: hypothetical protein A3I68_06325 [Candidatus Melainabacteria bacterium RIFCSPLOWO2_02_FULL_35_15]|nr:MAG: hypothetical protein A3F80_08100 [Candidatus Melainabacteria bacterium RIFCSPLOWO2_12_FULL_35_11]OGI14580.1 MAG: hypothetical protein A3I68_06325 [Candidatus Melainabacteria bacterium RIFCSPLOWO2_02_FULL_35_15]